MKQFILRTALILLYFIAVESMLGLLNIKKVKNGFEYFISRTFSNEEWETARAILEDFRSIGQRTYRRKNTILYLYKPFTTKYYTINEHGFRGEPITPKKPQEIRIVVGGASVMWGIFVPDDETIPEQIAARLNREFAHTGYHFTLWNLSVEAYDFQRIFALTKHFRRDIAPDGIFFYAGFADALYASVNGYNTHTPFTDNGPTEHAIFQQREASWLSDFTFDTRLGNLILNEFYTSTDFYPDFTAGTARNPEERRKQLKSYAASYISGFYDHVKEAANYYQRHEVPALFYFSPALVFKNPKSRDEKLFMEMYNHSFPLFDIYTERSISGVLERDRREKNLFIPLLDVFDSHRESIFWDKVHINPRGGRIIARTIANDLIERGFIQRLIDRRNNRKKHPK